MKYEAQTSAKVVNSVITLRNRYHSLTKSRHQLWEIGCALVVCVLSLVLLSCAEITDSDTVAAYIGVVTIGIVIIVGHYLYKTRIQRNRLKAVGKKIDDLYAHMSYATNVFLDHQSVHQTTVEYWESYIQDLNKELDLIVEKVK